jgi:NitT/TauT family transport system substrate-binding protein
MGVAVRAAEREVRLAEMRALARALARGLEFLHTAPISLIIEALPAELIAGGDRGQLEAIIERNRASLYPLTVDIDLEAARRVEQTLLTAGLLRPDSIELEHLFDLTVAGG